MFLFLRALSLGSYAKLFAEHDVTLDVLTNLREDELEVRLGVVCVCVYVSVCMSVYVCVCVCMRMCAGLVRVSQLLVLRMCVYVYVCGFG